jgi:dihydrofolate synthase / folylpolyglutamate synthase
MECCPSGSFLFSAGIGHHIRRMGIYKKITPYKIMIVKTIRTRILQPPKDDLFQTITDSVKSLPEKSVLVITSKIVAIGQGRCIPLEKYPDKDKLIMREADLYLPRKFVPGAWVMHTLKNNVFIPSAGIDESNADGYYILWPRNIARTAKEIWMWLREKYRVRDVGVLITDSHTIPMRRGVLGISLAHYGFAPLKDYRGTTDLFGRPLKMTQTNIADGLAAAAVVVMGEGKEATPLCLIKDVPWIQFVTKPIVSKRPFSSFEIKTQEDMYYPLLSRAPWRKGKKSKRA